MKYTFRRRGLKLLLAMMVAQFFMAACGGGGSGGGDGGGGGECERVTALAPGYGDIEIHNDLDTGLEAYFPELAFSALIRPGKCEIFGVPEGSRDVELTQCTFLSDNECNTFGNTRDLTIEVKEGDKEVIYAGDYLSGDNTIVNAPPTSSINSPLNGSSYDYGDNISFVGSASDDEDGPLIGNSLVWTSSIDGQIGTGTSFIKNNLSSSFHTITLTATDSDGETGSSLVNITVGIDIPPSQSWTMENLPDTGQTISYSNSWGEDSDYTINPPSYTDNGNGTITDNVTSLMWQQEDDEISRSWNDAIMYCIDLNFAGYNDWRLPSKKELMSIVNYGVANPSIDSVYFPNTKVLEDYWSSTSAVYDPSYAWPVSFLYGHILPRDKLIQNCVRCVRGGQ